MNICMVDRAVGSRQVPRTAESLRKLDHKVDVIGPVFPDRRYVSSYGRRPSAAHRMNDSMLGILINKALFAFHATSLLRSRARRIKYDVIYSEEGLAPYLNLRIPWRRRPPYVASHFGPLPLPDELRGLSHGQVSELVRKTSSLPLPAAMVSEAVVASDFKQAARVVANSHALKESLAIWVPVDPETIDVVPNGVDTEEFRPGTDGSGIRAAHGIGARDPLILSVGGIEPRKDQISVVKALKEFVPSHPRLRVMFVGPVVSQDYHHELRRFIRSQSLDAHVIFAGLVPYKSMPQCYATADIYVQLSTAEGMPESLLQAMSCGKACLASNIAHNREAAVRGDEVVYVDREDAGAVTETLRGLLANPSYRDELGLRARRTVLQHFSWDARAEKMLGSFEKALAVGR